MRVRMLTTYAGPSGTAREGEAITLSDAEGTALVDGGYAVALDAPAPAPAPEPEPAAPEPEQLAVVEEATEPAAEQRETAVVKRTRRK